jgi:hypothetical protein
MTKTGLYDKLGPDYFSLTPHSSILHLARQRKASVPENVEASAGEPVAG